MPFFSTIARFVWVGGVSVLVRVAVSFRSLSFVMVVGGLLGVTDTAISDN